MSKKHAKGNPGQGGKQPGAGKPKNIISDEDMARAEALAYNGCQNGTIATIMGWADAFITDRVDIRKKLTLKRAERKAWLRDIQFKQSAKNPVSAIFLGKNYLGQADKQEHKVGFDAETASLLSVVDGCTKGKLPSEE